MTVHKLVVWLGLTIWIVLAGCTAQAEKWVETPASVTPARLDNTTAVPPTRVPVAIPLATATPSATATPRPTAGPIEYQPEGRPVAVIVENEMAARPQSGLGLADALYEAVAEWNLTRFVAVFSSKLAETVGPVRSGRAYHTAIAAEYDAVLAQCLGVPSQRAVLSATKVFGLDGCQMRDPPGFWRDAGRRAPHNLYVTPPVLQKFAGGKGVPGLLGKRQAWAKVEDTVNGLRFVYPEDHEVRWHFDLARRQYLRWQDGAPHVLSDGEQLAATTVIVQFVAVQNSSYFNENGYHELSLVGEGNALIFAEQSKREAMWRRASLDRATRFTDERGAEILLPPGPVFVQLVAKGTEVQDN